MTAAAFICAYYFYIKSACKTCGVTGYKDGRVKDFIWLAIEDVKLVLMVKSLFEQLGGTYHEENGYLIPDLKLLDEKEQTIGIWGERHLRYLRQYRRVTYINLLTSGRLNAYLADIDRQAQERFERLIEGMKQAQGITNA